MKYLRYLKSTGRIAHVMDIKNPDFYIDDDYGLVPFDGSIADKDLQDYRIVDDEIVVRNVDDSELRERVQRKIKSKRLNRLERSDWTQVPDSPLDAQKKQAWKTYRQALRDLPDTYANETDFANVIWPTPPE